MKREGRTKKELLAELSLCREKLELAGKASEACQQAVRLP